MLENYIKRSLEPVLKKAAREFPALVLTGPRQSGKTTLLKHLFGKRYRYVSMDPPDSMMFRDATRVCSCEDVRSNCDHAPASVSM